MYAIVDIETTGGNPNRDKITEIAIYIHDGNKITDEFTSLVNPEREIPYYITKLTGITNEMVADAPKFYEIAHDIVKLTENKIFVAHNAGFDYGFIKSEFKSLGYNFKRQQLCTVKMSRKLIPGKKSYSLGNLCNELGIKITGRHRAAGDALATVKLLELLLHFNGKDKSLSLYEIDKNILESLNKSFNIELINNLPEETGVYYFINKNNDIIYIGKSKNIRKRVISHLKNNSKRSNEMKLQLSHISYELTGSELIALLKESEEIKKLKPVYNRAQRRCIATYGLFAFTDKNNYINLEIRKISSKDEPVTSFNSLTSAKESLFRYIEEFNLCQKLCGLYKSEHSCFQHQIGLCNGACIGLEAPDSYNSRVSRLIEKLKYEHNNMLLIDKGRNENEKAFILIKNGKYLGYNYISSDKQIYDIEQLVDIVEIHEDNKDVRQIINLFARKELVEKIILF
ncbi:MAG: exonuclease domain-containing protein [Marinilabiliales bacterium]